jgi:hypothetical protein
MVPSEAPILFTRIMPTSMRPHPEPRPLSSHPVSIAPLIPVPIEAFHEVTPNEAPPLPEVPPDATLAAPIEALPILDPDSDPVPRRQVPAVPRPAVPAVALNSVAPSSTSESTCSLGEQPTEAVAPRPDCPPPEISGDARAELARLVQRSVKAYESTTTWGEFVAQCRDSTGDFHPDAKHLPHRAAHLLDTLRRSGATVGMKTEPWLRQRKDEAL